MEEIKWRKWIRNVGNEVKLDMVYWFLIVIVTNCYKFSSLIGYNRDLLP